MTTSDTATPARWIALFDLDGTLSWHDTLLLFLMSYLRRHPWRSFRLWRLPFLLAGFIAGGRDRGLLKARVIRMVLGGAGRADIDACAGAFASGLKPRHRLRPAALAVLEAHRAAGDHLVLLSASPDLYVPSIGAVLGFELTLCTEIEWCGDRVEGALKSPNRRGAEKSRCLAGLRARYPGLRIVAYGNSASDLDHLRLADRALLVNGNATARSLAAQSGISTSNWG